MSRQYVCRHHGNGRVAAQVEHIAVAGVEAVAAQ
jgi:hypothetical protein